MNIFKLLSLQSTGVFFIFTPPKQEHPCSRFDDLKLKSKIKITRDAKP